MAPYASKTAQEDPKPPLPRVPGRPFPEFPSAPRPLPPSHRAARRRKCRRQLDYVPFAAAPRDYHSAVEAWK